MSVDTELTRAAQNAASVDAAKTAIASAITAKGGTVGASDGLADFPAAIAGIPSGGSIHEEVGTVTDITGTFGTTLNIPIEDSDYDNVVCVVIPKHTWVIEGDEWVPRATLDFTGTEGFKSGTWHTVPFFTVACVMKRDYTRNNGAQGNTTFSSGAGKGHYSNGTAGNSGALGVVIADGILSIGLVNTTVTSVADCGITYSYHIWGWNNE